MVEDVVVKKSTFAISSPGEFLVYINLHGRAICRDLEEQTIDFVGNPERTNYLHQGGYVFVVFVGLSVCLSVC